MKFMSSFLAFMFLMYAIVTFIYVDPDTKKLKPTIENTLKGLLYLILALVIAWMVSTV
jgi:hypothetical protein